LSLLRGFSAPVKVDLARTNAELAFLMANDKDSFSRWNAGQQLFIAVLLQLVDAAKQGKPLMLPVELVEQLTKVLADADSDPALVAKMLVLPSENYLAAQQQLADVDAIHAAHHFVKKELALKLKALFSDLYSALNTKEKYAFNADNMAKRSLKNICLDYLMATNDPMQTQRCLKQMKQADNMTDTLAGVNCLVEKAGPESEHALRAFYEQWQHDKQVVDKWLAVQAQSSLPDALIRVKGLMRHPAFNLKNPNNVRSLIGHFCRNNPVNFHALDGSGYQFLAEQILLLDKLNPQIAARQMGAFNSWRQYDVRRQELMRNALERISQQKTLSKDVYEIVTKYLATD
jgi:aminopeptidase N